MASVIQELVKVAMQSSVMAACAVYTRNFMQWHSGVLGPDPGFRCARCLGKAWPIDGRAVKEVKVDDKNLAAFPEFCYLGDIIYAV